ncbi:MAG: tetratricopeptide repeat protein, partial [Gammaproteobacteria bacterium]|nr:tetratricopeptide repeat protein [Gammaproteobacteria bacterium]
MALLGLWCLHATTGHAQDVATRVTPAISEPVYAALAKAQRLVSAGDPEAARVLLDRLREGRRLTPYEIAQSWNYTAYIELQREAYASAIAAYREVLEQGELPEALRQGTLKTLAQLHFTVGEYARAIERVQAFEGVGGLLDPDLHMLLGQAHYELAEFAAALPHVEKAVAMSRAAG